MDVALELLGAIALGLVGLVLLGLLLRKVPFPRWWSKRLPLELAPSAALVAAAIGDVDDPRRAKKRRLILVDFVFIAYYTGIFAALAVVLAYRDESWALWISVAAGVAAAATALADIRENVGVLRMLEQTLASLEDRMVAGVRLTSLLKWAFCAATLALLSGLFWGEGRDEWVFWIGVSYVVAAAIGVLGLIQQNLLPLFFASVVLVVGATLVLFAFSPERFTQGF